MRPFLALFALIGAAILVSALTVTSRPRGPELPPAEEAVETVKPPAPDSNRNKAFDSVQAGAVRAKLVIKDRGEMILEFYPKAAPKTVAHITDLIKKKFYDGIKVHRVEPTFVVQMGDPETKNLAPDQFEANMIGSHGSGTLVPLEKKLPHLPMTIGLARANAPDSGDSQFYINLNDNFQLDSGYCVFGRVVEGADVPAKIRVGDVITSLTLL